MGTATCRYDAEKHSIDCEVGNGNMVHLEVAGTAIDGRMTLADGRLWRKISLHKVTE